MALKVALNLNRLSSIKPRLISSGHNRLLDGPTWGLNRASSQISAISCIRNESVEFPYFVLASRSLNQKLSDLGVVTVSLTEQASPERVRSMLRELLYQPLEKDFSSDNVVLVPGKITDCNGTRHALEENRDDYSRVLPLLENLCANFGHMTNEQIADVLGVFPRDFKRTRSEIEPRSVGTGRLAGNGNQYEEERVDVDFVRTFGVMFYSSIRIEMIKSYLQELGDRKDDILDKLQRRNEDMHQALTIGTLEFEEVEDTPPS